MDVKALAMNPLQALRGLDQRFVNAAVNSAAANRLAAEEALVGRRNDLYGRLAPEGGLSEEQLSRLAPEVLSALLAHQKREAMPNRPKPNARSEAAGRMAQELSGLGALPTQARDEDRAAVQAMLQQGLVGDINDQHNLARALVEYQLARDPGMANRAQSALAGVNNAIATNPYARAGAYTGIGAGGAAGAVGLTEAGMKLLEMAGLLEADNDAYAQAKA